MPRNPGAREIAVEQQDQVESQYWNRFLKRKWIPPIVIFAFLLTIGVFARNEWIPSTERKTSWFGKRVPDGVSIWYPFPTPNPTPAPQLAREYLYAGSRLLNVIDAGAQEAPPADLAVWRASTGGWWVLGGTGSQHVAQNWGATGDKPVPGDYDGDGKTDFSVFRVSTNTWYFIYSSTNTTAGFAFGASGDIPAPADYDGDGKTDSAVFRADTGAWYINQSSTGQTAMPQFGSPGDRPAPADHDGDGRADTAVWRESTKTFWSANSSNGSSRTVLIGQPGIPVSADYDGDGKADYAVFNKANGNWHITPSATGQLLPPVEWGLANDVPVQNDYDADGKCDLAVWRPTNSPGYSDLGNWYIRQSGSNNAARTVQWGIEFDIPVPAFYRR